MIVKRLVYKLLQFENFTRRYSHCYMNLSEGRNAVMALWAEAIFLSCPEDNLSE